MSAALRQVAAAGRCGALPEKPLSTPLTSTHPGRYGLDAIGLHHDGKEYWNLRPAELVSAALRRGEATLSDRGALVARTGKRTGRSPRDKYVVREPSSEKNVHWGDVNVAIEPGNFEAIKKCMFGRAAGHDLYIQDLYAGAEPENRLRVRMVTERAWHSLFVRNLFIRPDGEETANHPPDFTVVDVPECPCGTELGMRSEAYILVHFAQRLVLIGGTHYAGEMKKAIFTIMNYLLPLKGVMSMHCSANVGKGGDVALFFGLSGTGKTTLSADPQRGLIGDDEHGWSDRGVFNFEGGCYAKCINLSEKYEPQIYNAIRFGSVLENVVLDPVTQAPIYEDASLTENTRCAYPLNYIDNAIEPSVAGHPQNIVFLTCDAFGVLPPVSRLTPEQAMYHFLSGYTAKVAGTEAGVTEPQTTFSTCFGAPFMVLNPAVYADLLGKKIAKHKSRVWLVNTGWSGGPYGVGSRMKLPYTRAMITAALGGQIDEAAYEPHPIFGVSMPKTCPGVPAEVLNPRSTWKDAAAYDAKAKDLAGRFAKNFEKFTTSPAIKAAGPKA
ncbi:MAG: phosphoenolpyruvate carboxykinase (ATP) [Planctomycetes bacterium]|nr:phosphoenolpyruvate carboxykinase (ATP) [Planctomycetota bacterium]